MNNEHLAMSSDDLINTDWPYLNYFNTNEAFHSFQPQFSETIDVHAPEGTVRIPAKGVIPEVWMTPYLLSASTTSERLNS